MSISTKQSDKPLVLVADDDPTHRMVIQEVLQQSGFRVLTAADGKVGLEMFVRAKPDVVLLDVEMPEMDGYTLTSSVRKDDRLKGLFIVLHTSLSGVFNESMVKSVGADRFIAKFNADDLANFVLEQLGCESEVEATD